MSFGENVSAVRKKKGLSQDELAKKEGTISVTIGRYERNEIKPSIEIAKKISDTLEVSLDYLAGEGLSAKYKQTVKRLEDIERLPSEEKNIVYKMIDMALVYSKTKKALAG